MLAHAYNLRILEMGHEDQFKVILSYSLHSKFEVCLGYMRREGEKENKRRGRSQVVVAFNCSIWEAEAGRSLRLRPAWSTK